MLSILLRIQSPAFNWAIGGNLQWGCQFTLNSLVATNTVRVAQRSHVRFPYIDAYFDYGSLLATDLNSTIQTTGRFVTVGSNQWLGLTPSDRRYDPGFEPFGHKVVDDRLRAPLGQREVIVRLTLRRGVAHDRHPGAPSSTSWA